MKLFKFLILSVDVLYPDALFLFVLSEIYLGFRNNYCAIENFYIFVKCYVLNF